MRKPDETGRSNQRRRTRKELLAASARLLKQGITPDMEQVAKEAMISRATAYRYFPSIEALLVEAPLDRAMPEPDDLFAAETSKDPLARIDMAEGVLHELTYRNEAQLRVMLAASLERRVDGSTNNRVPVRQNRRTALIEAALAPARDRFTPTVYKRLTSALALILGTESMIVFRDVLPLDEKTARRVKSWAVRALVTAALQESSESR